MAATTKDTTAKGASLTDRELEILGKAWKCMKTTPEVDYARLAAECGMTNDKSASNAWGRIKKKIFPDIAGDASAAAASSNTPPATPSRKRKAGAGAGAGAGPAAAAGIARPADGDTDMSDGVGGTATENGVENGTENGAEDVTASANGGDAEDSATATATATPKRRRATTSKSPRTPKTPKTPKTVRGAAKPVMVAINAAAVKADDADVGVAKQEENGTGDAGDDMDTVMEDKAVEGEV